MDLANIDLLELGPTQIKKEIKLPQKKEEINIMDAPVQQYPEIEKKIKQKKTRRGRRRKKEMTEEQIMAHIYQRYWKNLFNFYKKIFGNEKKAFDYFFKDLKTNAPEKIQLIDVKEAYKRNYQKMFPSEKKLFNMWRRNGYIFDIEGIDTKINVQKLREIAKNLNIPVKQNNRYIPMRDLLRKIIGYKEYQLEDLL